MLERIRLTFYVRAVAIRLLDEDGAPIDIHAGAPLPWPDDALVQNLQRGAARDTVVVPDLDLEAGAAGRESRDGRVRFFAGIPLLSASGHPFGVLSLLHTHPRWLSAVHVRAFEDLAAELAPLALQRRDAVTIVRLRSRIAAQAADFAHERDTFEQAASEARLGIWECTLQDQRLSWTPQVYDLFEIPRGTGLVREKTLECYTAASRGILERVRSEALVQRHGFRLDAEITTQKGGSRWIRINASIDCRAGRPMRLFGMKQDITEQKLLLDEARLLAERDAMTGLANRVQFEKRLSKLGSESPDRSDVAALMLIDLDGFKQVNDRYGHAVGDACLKESTRRLSGVCGQAHLVARIGGDEFGVVIDHVFDDAAIEALGETIIAALSRPMACAGHILQIGASVGIARVAGPCLPADLFTQADIALYAAKAAGRGTLRSFAPGMGNDPDRRIAWPIAPDGEQGGSLRHTTH